MEIFAENGRVSIMPEPHKKNPATANGIKIYLSFDSLNFITLSHETYAPATKYGKYAAIWKVMA